MLLACGTAGMTFIGFWFLCVVPHGAYQSVADDEDDGKMEVEDPPTHGGMFEPGRSSPNNHRKTTALRKVQADQGESGKRVEAVQNPFDLTSGRTGEASGESSALTTAASSTIVADPDDSDETSSLVTRTSSIAGEVFVQSVDLDRSHRVDIRGWDLMRSLEFWQLFAVMGILAGIGLMTIK